MNKFVVSNISQLKKLKQKSIGDTTTQVNKKRIDEIIKLYTERKISNVAAAENLIKGLTSSNKKVYDKAFQKYKDNINKFKEAKPLKERMAETKKRKQKNTYFVNFDLYTVRQPKSQKMKPAFKLPDGRHFYIDSFKVRSATVKANEFPRDVIKRRVLRYETREDEALNNENPVFTDLIKLLEQDKDFEDLTDTLKQYYDDLFDAIKVQSVELVNKNGEKFDIMTQNLTDAVNVSVYHDYIHTPIRMEAETIKKAIERGNYIDNLCWVNALNDFYGDTLMSEKSRKRLTRERIIEIIGKKDFDTKGASINDMEKVFKEYNIQVRIFNFFSKLIYKFDPEKRNHHIKTFYAMVKNNHIYVLNHDLKSIQQKQVCDIPVVKASADYYINERDEPPKYKMIQNVNEILKIKTDDETNEVYIVLENNDLTEALFKLISSGYEPRIRFEAGIVSEIRMKFDKIKYIIKTQNLLKTSVDGCIAVSDEKTYNHMNLAMFNFCKSLFIPSQKSFYNDIDVKILDEARTIVPSGIMTKEITNVEAEYYTLVRGNLMSKATTLSEIDLSKAFTSAFLKIDEKPVFNQFDIWKAYDGKIEEHNDFTLYYIKNKHFGKNKFLLNKEYVLLYKLILKEVINDIDVEILYYKTPSQLHKCNHQEIINELWNMSISDDVDEDKYIKKLIANVNFGLLEKGGATDQKSLLFKHLNEALEYQAEYGGKIHKISDREMYDEMIDGDDITEVKQVSLNSNDYYILNLKDQAQLKNGFRYIKELLLQFHNYEMYKSFQRLKGKHIQILSVKTDAFVINTSDVEKAKDALDFNDEIGGWRISKSNNDILFPTTAYEIVENDLIKINTYEHKDIEIKDEYATDDIIEEVKMNNPMMIRGELPGTGKSYICQKMVDKGFKVIFVCPTNKLLQAFEGEAITINKFFGISFGDVKLEAFDYSFFDVIVFDEIYFSSLSIYWRIAQFVEQNKDKKIILATGDTKQLKPVQEITNVQEYDVYADHIINLIFSNSILLKECKRLHTQEDKEKLTNIKIDIFENKLSIKKIINKYNFEYTTDISGSKNNIAFLNNTCKNVSNEIRKLENRKDEYEVGEYLICREYTKTKSGTFNVNFVYKIVYIGGGFLKLKNDKTGKVQPLVIDKVRKNFIFAYCSTCHSAQGSSIDDTITIFDYSHFLVKNYPEWIWTAITRCRDLNKVKFFKYSSDTNDEFNEKCIMSYFERKIEAYKLQDRKAKRKIPKEGYVNGQWFLDNIKNQCNYCGCGFYLDMKNGNITSNLTCQRKDNELTHTLDNIIPYCCRCNCSCK